ncbi:MAG: YdcF family protein [Clostridium sp.]|nr:YdcF family protein [Clostridium sp.]
MKPSNDKARVTAPEAARVLCFVFAAVLVIQAIITLFCANFSVGVILNFAYAAFVCLCGVLLGKVGRVLRIIATAAVIAPLIFGCALFACGAKDNADGSEKAIIVLGCGIDGERISPKLTRRLDKAIEYFNEHPDKPVIVSGGQGAQEDIPESTAMKRYLVSKGVPDGMIIEESNSTSTFENFEFSKDIADTLPGGDRIVFVTSRFHIYRASRYAAGAGFEAHHIGARVPFYELPSNYLREMLAVVKFFNWEKIFPKNEAGG